MSGPDPADLPGDDDALLDGDAADHGALVAALQAAHHPAPLAASEHDALFAAALAAVDGAAEEDALVEALAAAWRPGALAASDGDATLAALEDAAVVEAALVAALRPTDLAPEAHEALLQAALPAPARTATVVPFRRRPLAAAASLLSALAVAAGVVLVVRPAPAPPSISVASGEAVAGPAASPAQRTERLARARAADYRENRYRALGLPPSRGVR